MEEKAIKKSDFLKVLISAVIVQEGFNVREDMGDLDVLAKQIAAQGQNQPLKGIRNGDTIILTAGHRRLEAIKLANSKYGANIERVDVITSKADDKARVLEMLNDGESAKPLTNKEMVKGIERLIAMGVSKKEIVESLGASKSQAQAYNLIAVAGATQAVKKMFENGEISAAKVNEIQRSTKDEQEQGKLAQEASKAGRKPRQEKEAKVSADIAKLEQALELADPTTAKASLLKAVVSKLKAKASAEDIANLLK